MTEGQTITGVRAEPVPFLDLRSSHDPIREALLDDFRALTVSGAFTNGPQVAEFEDGLRRLLWVRPLRRRRERARRAPPRARQADSEPGDEVIVPANTFVATFEAVSQAGGTPVPVDVSYDDYSLDRGRCRGGDRAERRGRSCPCISTVSVADMAALSDSPRGTGPVRPRGRLPGARRRARRRRAGPWGTRRVQLLPREEPRSHG